MFCTLLSSLPHLQCYCIARQPLTSFRRGGSLGSLCLVCRDKVELAVKYGGGMGLKFPNGLLFKCNWKVLEGCFQFLVLTCFYLL